MFDKLKQAIENQEDITDLLEGMSKDEFLSIFREKLGSDQTLFGHAAIVVTNQAAMIVILNAAKEKDALKEIVTEEMMFLKEEESEIYYSLIDCITGPKLQFPSGNLNTIEKSCGLKAFWKVISENERTSIKDKLANKNKDRAQMEAADKRMLWEIFHIEKSMAADKAMKVGGASSVVAGLIALGGCFAAGAALPMLAIVGIAVAAALVAGLVASGITYAVSKPSNKLDVQSTQETELKDMSNKESCPSV